MSVQTSASSENKFFIGKQNNFLVIVYFQTAHILQDLFHVFNKFEMAIIHLIFKYFTLFFFHYVI